MTIVRLRTGVGAMCTESIEGPCLRDQRTRYGRGQPFSKKDHMVDNHMARLLVQINGMCGDPYSSPPTGFE